MSLGWRKTHDSESLLSDRLWLNIKEPKLAAYHSVLGAGLPSQVNQWCQATMRVLWLRWRAVVAAAILLIIIFAIYYSRPSPEACAKSTLEHEDLAHVAYYCNPIERAAPAAQEGRVTLSKYHLEQVHAVIRHGDRYTLHTLPRYDTPGLSCDMERFPELQHHVPEVAGYVETMQANVKRMPPGSLFQKFPLYPDQGRCDLGHLTPRGAAQHIRNGAELKKVYLDKWGLLKKQGKKQVELVSTVRRRTFQSGLALLYGLLPDFDLSTVGLTHVPDARMCANGYKIFPCHCYAIQRFIDIIGGTFGQTRPDFVSQPRLKAAYKDVAEALGVPVQTLPRSSQVMDVTMVHVCNHLPLPGKPGQCIKPQSVRHVVEAINSNGLQHTNHTVYRQISRLRMLPLLHQIMRTMQAGIKGEVETRFVLHSGHDSTLAPLLEAMNATNGMWPPYASRVVFELYSTQADSSANKKHFLRVLYNGQDITQTVGFCRGKTSPEWDNMCSFEFFRNFIFTKDGLADFGLDNYSETCGHTIEISR